MMSVRSVRTSLRLSAISGLPALRRTGPSRWKIDAAWHSRSLGRDLVAGDLLDQEPVERLVAVEGVDDVVAESPGVGDVAVVLEALGLGVADDVEPVLRPALAVSRAGQQPVDDPLLGDRANGRPRTPRSPRARAAGRSRRRSRGGATRRARPAARAATAALRAWRGRRRRSGPATQAASLTRGGAGFCTGWNAQCARACWIGESADGRAIAGRRIRCAGVDPRLEVGDRSARGASASSAASPGRPRGGWPGSAGSRRSCPARPRGPSRRPGASPRASRAAGRRGASSPRPSGRRSIRPSAPARSSRGTGGRRPDRPRRQDAARPSAQGERDEGRHAGRRLGHGSVTGSAWRGVISSSCGRAGFLAAIRRAVR